MINPIEEKKAIAFLKGLVSLYEENNVTTEYDYDYVSFIVDGDHAGFPDYNGEGFLVHYPKIDAEAIAMLQEMGDALYGNEVVKKVDKPGADKIYDTSPMKYNLKCYVYPDQIKYVLVASAYSEKTNTYEDRERVIPVSELFK